MIKVVQLTSDSREHYKNYDAPLPYFGTAPEALLAGFAGMPGVEIHVVCCLRQPASSPEKIADNIYYHSVVVPKLGWGRTFFLGCALAVRKRLREIQPDIVHGQGTERDCAISAVLSGFPNVLTIHGHMARIAEILGSKPLSYYWLAKKLESFAVRKSGGVVCITRYTRDRLAATARRTWVIPNAVDPSFFDVQSPGRGNLALCVASLSPWKRQLELIYALDELPEAIRPRLAFLGVDGGGGYGTEVFAAIKTRPWCSYEGMASRSELKSWLQKAGLLILPSIEDNCPMVVLEAMAAGVPVAAARIGGIPDLIDDGRTGLLFDPRDPDCIRSAISRWATDPDAAATRAAASHTEALARFHPQVVARQHLALYQELLASRS